MDAVIEFLVANPILLIPALIIVATMAFAILKRLLKMAAIVAIAGVLYVVLMEYMSGGM